MWTILLYGAQTALGIAGLCTVLAVVVGYVIGIRAATFPSLTPS